MTSSLRHQVAAMWHACRGRRDNALAHHRAALDQDPAHWSALFFVLAQLQREGRDAEALAAAQRALESEPSHFLALQTAACLSVKLGRYGEGKHYVERALSSAPDVRAGSTPILDGFHLIAWRLARLLRRRRALSVPPEAPSWATARHLDDWKQWALGYLAWCKATNAAGSTGAGE